MRPQPKVLIERAVELCGGDEVVHWAAALLSWRVREMCAKVCRRRELAEGSAALAVLAGDPVVRVRVSAYNAIADLCEADSAEPLLAVSFERPREADEAAAALRRMEQRLDRRLG